MAAGGIQAVQGELEDVSVEVIGSLQLDGGGAYVNLVVAAGDYGRG